MTQPLPKFPRTLPPLQQQSDKQPEEERRVAFQDVQEPHPLDPPPNHDSGMTHKQFISDPLIYSCFPTGARFSNRLSRMIRFQAANLTYVDILNQQETLIYNPFDLNAKDQEAIRDKTVILKVLATSQLQLDTNIMHPFVRMHIVNMKNGCYITKPKLEHQLGTANAIYGFETNCITNIIDGEKERRACELELVTAFSTNCCDLRQSTNSRACWDEEILINLPADYLFSQDSVILFELLDFHPQYLSQKNMPQLDCDNFYRIAWGFMRTNGLSKLHLGVVKIQLYQYVFDTHNLGALNRRESIPLVYFDFLWPSKVEYDAILNVYVGTQPMPPFVDVFERSMNVFQVERGDRDIKEKLHQDHKVEEQEDKIEELTEQEKTCLRRRRYATDKMDSVPDKIAYKFASAPLGCYRLTFNRHGNYLAAACTYRNSKTIIKLFDMESGQPFGIYKGHRNIIHDLQFSPLSNYLCSSSSDYTTKIWLVPKSSGEVVSEDESDGFQIASLQHPSYVYAGLFLNDTTSPFIVTACFDSRIRVWNVDCRQVLQIIDEPIQQEVVSLNGLNFDEFDDLLTHRHPNCLVYDGSRCMFSGDSQGGIHVYDINLSGSYIVTRMCLILNPEMEGDPINCIQLMPPECQDLLVHSRDNCLRIVDYKSTDGKYVQSETLAGTVTTRFLGTVSQRICVRSVASPNGDFVLSGSEDGKPHLWSSLAMVQPTEQFQYSLIGPVADVAWNQSYHMVALAGFGDEHPIVVYVWEREGDMNFIEAKKLQDQTKFRARQYEDIHLNFSPPQNRNSRINQQTQGLFQPQLQQTTGPFGGTQGPFGGTQGPFGSAQGPFGSAQPQQQSQPFGSNNQGPFSNNQGPFSNNQGPFGNANNQGSVTRTPFGQNETSLHQRIDSHQRTDSNQGPFGNNQVSSHQRTVESQQGPFSGGISQQPRQPTQQSDSKPFGGPQEQMDYRPPNHPNTPFGQPNNAVQKPF